jgi:peptidoglycan/xylan/chitin deacetylase (PgdA/CDA1 family)
MGALRIILAFHWITRRRFVAAVKTALRGRDACDLNGLTLEGKSPRKPGLALTFDDGYEEVVELGSDVAAEYGWPVTFYLPTDYLDGLGMWQEELTTLVRHAPPGRYEIFGVEVVLPHAQGRKQVIEAVKSEIKRSGSSGLRASMEAVRAELDPDGVAPVAKEMPKPISWTRVAELAGRKEITFGSHTVTHTPLAALSAESVEWEAVESRRRIEKIVQRPVEHFCYPFGTLAEIGPAAPRIVGKHYRTAVTMHRGRITRDTDHAWVPRVDLYEGDSRLRVELKLVAGWLAGSPPPPG